MRSEFNQLHFEFGKQRTAPLFIYLVYKKTAPSHDFHYHLYLYYFFIIFFFYLIRQKNKAQMGYSDNSATPNTE